MKGFVLGVIVMTVVTEYYIYKGHKRFLERQLFYESEIEKMNQRLKRLL